MDDLVKLFSQLIELPESLRNDVFAMAKEKKQRPAALASLMAKQAPTLPRSMENPALSAESKVRSMGGKLGALQRGV